MWSQCQGKRTNHSFPTALTTTVPVNSSLCTPPMWSLGFQWQYKSIFRRREGGRSCTVTRLCVHSPFFDQPLCCPSFSPWHKSKLSCSPTVEWTGFASMGSMINTSTNNLWDKKCDTIFFTNYLKELLCFGFWITISTILTVLVTVTIPLIQFLFVVTSWSQLIIGYWTTVLRFKIKTKCRSFIGVCTYPRNIFKLTQIFLNL